MKKAFLVISLSLGCHAVFSQATTSQPTGIAAERNLHEIGNSGNLSGVVQTFDNRYEGVKGSPYFFQNWGDAVITSVDNKVYASVPLKYNALENTLVYQNNKGVIYVLAATIVDRFTLKDSLGLASYTFKKLDAPAKTPDQFYLVLHEGPKILLAMRQDKHILKADFKGGYSAGRPYDEIVTQNVYYLHKPGKTAEKVKLSKKQLLEAIADQKEAVSHFIKENNIDAGSESGWVKVLAYYETL
ncbi:hypothetical protein [uncultured Pontibacter sp.]|uniref:hypothetical protein n=1 Tax=uncultured Pontibacter sp. TaxID=453356 RepID=UPI0026195E88|nr:hypothetical protein [uncultured Pontibacter sp.]